MATHMLDRSTYWVNGGGVDNPVATGDYRYWWSIYYETDKTNRKTKFTVDYYLQYHFTDYGEDDPYSFIVPSGTSTVYINGSSIGSVKTSTKTIEKGTNKVRVYIGQKTFSINHSNDGSASFTFQGFGFGIGTSSSTYSTPKNFPSIPSQSKLGEIKTFDIDSGISSIGVTKYVDGYYDVLQISNGSNVFKTINGFKNGDPVTFTETELDDIYTKIPTGDKATFTFKLTTYTNSSKTTTIGTDTKTATGNFTIVLPTVKGAICEDIVINTVDLTGDTTRQTIIKDYSHIVVKIPASMHATANTRKATIKEYIIEDKHITYDASGHTVYLDERDENGNVIHNSEAKYTQKDHIVIYAVDSRETSSLPFTQKFTNYIDYHSITINGKDAKIQRDDNGISRFVTVSFEGTWWQKNFGVVENSLTTVVYYRNAEDGYWTDINEFVNGAEIGHIDESLIDTSTPGVFKYNGPISSNKDDKGFDISIPYDMLIVLFDEISNRFLAITVEYGEPAIAVYKNKAALGGPYDESLGGTQLWGDIYVNGEPHGSDSSGSAQRHAISAILANDYTDSFGAWLTYRIYFDKVTVVGDKLTYNQNTGRIIVGAGVSKVRIGGCAYYCGKKTEAENHPDKGVTLPACEMRVWCTTYNADGAGIDSTPAYLKHENNNTNTSVNVPDKIFEVGEGWQIDMGVQVSINSTVTLVRKGTTLYVEVME